MLPLRHYLVSDVIFLLAVDGLLAFGWIYFYAIDGLPPRGVTSALIGSTLAMLLMWAMGVYDRWSLFDRGHIATRLLATALAGYLLVAGVNYLGSGEAIGVFGGMLVVTGMTVSVAALHLVFPQVSTAARLQRRVLVIGSGAEAAKITACVGGSAAAAVKVVGFVSPAELKESLAVDSQRMGIDEIVVFGSRRSLPLQVLLRCRVCGIAVTDHHSFWEREMGRVFLDDPDPTWLIYSEGFRSNLINDSGKRGLDILLSLIGLIMAAPIMAAVALLIRLDSPGPVLYAQQRVGRQGREFTLYKFRSMRCDAEKDGVPQWAAKNDQRITRLGAWLRQLRLDELPQLYNVLRGDMSLIGPRPERAYFVEQLRQAIPYYDLRHHIRPGLTGWAQVSYKYTDSVEDAKVKFSYDFYYLKNRGLLLDLLIILQTIQIVLFPKNVH